MMRTICIIVALYAGPGDVTIASHFCWQASETVAKRETQACYFEGPERCEYTLDTTGKVTIEKKRQLSR